MAKHMKKIGNSKEKEKYNNKINKNLKNEKKENDINNLGKTEFEDANIKDSYNIPESSFKEVPNNEEKKYLQNSDKNNLDKEFRDGLKNDILNEIKNSIKSELKDEIMNEIVNNQKSLPIQLIDEEGNNIEWKKVKKRKKSNKIILLFRVISLIVIIICGYQLVNWYFENKKNNDILNDMVSNYVQSTKQIIIGDDAISVTEAKLDDLLEKNSDTVRMAYSKINQNKLSSCTIS